MHRYSSIIKYINILVDLILLNLSFVIAFYIKFAAFYDPFLGMLLYLNISWFMIVLIMKPYKISRTTSKRRIIGINTIILFLHLLSVFAFYVVQINHQYSRELLTIMYGLLAGSLLFWKIIFHYSLSKYRKKGFNYRNVVIVHKHNLNNGIDDYLKANPQFGYKVIKEFFADNNNQDKIDFELKDFCNNNKVDEIFYSINVLKYGGMINLIHFAEEKFIKFRIIADFKGFMFRGFEIDDFGDLPVLKILGNPLENQNNLRLKRSFDILFSLLVILFILSWLTPLLWVLIKISSKGPLFFKQKRTGKDNINFWCYKFRTMHVNEDSDTLQSTKGDRRITKIGYFLRKSSIDELPQFFNVLIGNMSVVGPRPHMLQHTKEMNQEVDQFMIRHSIKPGITGLAQSKGFRGETPNLSDKINRVKLDTFYLKKWTFYFDLVIILQTIVGLFLKEEKTNNQ